MAQTDAQTKKLSNDELASLKQAFLDWFARKTQKNLNILITGKTGVGKSRLLNALVGKKVAKEGREKKACTANVNPYKVIIDNIKVVVWDSPGLQDGTGNDQVYLTMLQDKLKQHGFDLMIYCIKMDDRRFYPEDQTAIQILTTVLGEDMWKKAVIALTFANRIEDPDEKDDLAYFMGDQYYWEKDIREFLSKLGIDIKLRCALPIVPAGNYKKLCLPTCQNWLAELWIQCLSVMSHSAGLALYQINKNRLKYSCSADMAAACSSQTGNEWPAESDSSQADTDDLGDIPREIPLNAQQEDTFLRTMWSAFVMSGIASIASVVTFTILRVLFRH